MPVFAIWLRPITPTYLYLCTRSGRKANCKNNFDRTPGLCKQFCIILFENKVWPSICQPNVCVWHKMIARNVKHGKPLGGQGKPPCSALAGLGSRVDYISRASYVRCVRLGLLFRAATTRQWLAPWKRV